MRPPVSEEREVYRLHAEAVKKRKEAAEAAADKKRRRKEKHDKACKIARAEGKPRPATPESTDEEEDTSDAEANLLGDDEVAIGVDWGCWRTRPSRGRSGGRPRQRRDEGRPRRQRAGDRLRP